MTDATNNNSNLRWAPPAMNNPTVIDLNTTGNKTYWQFSPNQDVIFLGANKVDTNTRLQTDGGHNIMVLGGDFQPTGHAVGTLYFGNLTGEAWVDGVHINNVNAGQRDGIDINGAPGSHPNLVVQNSIIENISGAQSGVHGDMVQTQGPTGDLDFYNVTGTTNYQGLFIAPQHDTGSATLENVNLRYTGPTDAGSNSSYLLWTLDDSTEKPYPISFNNVYVEPRAGTAAEESTVWPKHSLSDIGNTVQGNQISWPSLPYSGHVTVGAPPGGDFVNPANIGTNFPAAAHSLADLTSHVLPSDAAATDAATTQAAWHSGG